MSQQIQHHERKRYMAKKESDPNSILFLKNLIFFTIISSKRKKMHQNKVLGSYELFKIIEG